MISRTAQVVALAFFCMGRKMTAQFHRPTKLSDKTVEGLQELEKAGMLEIKRTKRDGWECVPTDKIGCPMRDFKPVDRNIPDENFRVMKS